MIYICEICGNGVSSEENECQVCGKKNDKNYEDIQNVMLKKISSMYTPDDLKQELKVIFGKEERILNYLESLFFDKVSDKSL